MIRPEYDLFTIMPVFDVLKDVWTDSWACLYGFRGFYILYRRRWDFCRDLSVPAISQ